MCIKPPTLFYVRSTAEQLDSYVDFGVSCISDTDNTMVYQPSDSSSDWEGNCVALGSRFHHAVTQP